ncbi:MAG TPA: response regulator [Ramlibacter sp.]|jgi:CheY-like chemotaxis protein|nr:response regulator [Ramlibacter sp.]
MSTTSTREPRLPRILVVDDMPDNLFLMNGLFEDRYRVVQAGSGQEALKVVMSDDPPDMVLLDIMMPDMDGYEVMRRIRQHPPTANIPIIFLTALASQQDERLGMDLGALDYLTKPVDPELVVQRVEAHMRENAFAKRVEELSEKLARNLSPDSWQRLFHGPAFGSIRFDEKVQTVLYAEGPEVMNVRDHESFSAELGWLAARHHGRVDRFSDNAGIVFFDEPASCVRMAMDLQRSANDLRLRMGVHTGICNIGTFRSDDWHCTLIGPETGLAAKVAATAAIGSIAISPETYALVKDDIHTDAGGCLVMEEFHDSDLAQVCLTPTPIKRGEHALSTFAGLGSQ